MFSSSNTWANYAFMGISGIGFAANFKGFKYISKTFNVNDNLFHILALDALITTTLNGLYSFSSSVMMAVISSSVCTTIALELSFKVLVFDTRPSWPTVS